MRCSGLLMLALASLNFEQSQAQTPCCSKDADCAALSTPEEAEYLERYGKALVCDAECPEAMNCNMFGICETCRGCFMTCEGAIKYMNETAALENTVNFCENSEVEYVSECYEDSASSASASAAGGSTAFDGGSLSSGMTGSGTARGGGVTSREALGSGTASAAGVLTGSASGSATASAADVLTGSASGSGSATTSASEVGNTISCACNYDDLQQDTIAFLCSFGKSVYCDPECLSGADPDDVLISGKGGLWCDPFGWDGCRLCLFDCHNDECVPCPPDVQDWCNV